jgi:hypothetical protein
VVVSDDNAEQQIVRLRILGDGGGKEGEGEEGRGRGRARGGRLLGHPIKRMLDQLWGGVWKGEAWGVWGRDSS